MKQLLSKKAVIGLCVILSMAAFAGLKYRARYRTPSSNELLQRGNLIWYNQPAAIQSEGIIYAGWMTSKREIVVSASQAADPNSLRAVVVDKHKYLDDHGAPIVHLPATGPDAGRVRVVYCLHNSPILTRVSGINRDISTWSKTRTIDSGECTYPTLSQTRHNLMLTYRRTLPESRPYCWRVSIDDGASFGDDNILVHADAERWVYAIPVSDPAEDAVDVLFGIAEDSIVKHVYHIHSDDNGQHWKSHTGQSVDTPIRASETQRCFETMPDRETRVWDVQPGAGGQVFAVWADYDSKNVILYWASWRPGAAAWSFEEICRQGLVYYPAGACIASVDPPSIVVSRPNEDGVHKPIRLTCLDDDWTAEDLARFWPSEPERSLVRPMAVRNSGGRHFMCVEVRSYGSFEKFDTALRCSFCAGNRDH